MFKQIPQKTRKPFVKDIFEQLGEFVVDTGKTSTKAVVTTFNPLNALKPKEGQMNPMGNEKSKGETQKSGGYTPLDLDKLQKKYASQDEQTAQILKDRLFQLVRSGDEKVLYDKKEKEFKKKHQAEADEEEKKRLIIMQRQQSEQSIPQGKARKSIFSHKKVAQREQVEVKPTSGKQ